MANEVFTGIIRRVFTRQNFRSEGFADSQLVLEIEIDHVSKGRLAPRSIAYVGTWTILERPELWVGDGGQRPLPREGDEGTFFVRTSEQGVHSLLHPNGWDRA